MLTLVLLAVCAKLCLAVVGGWGGSPARRFVHLGCAALCGATGLVAFLTLLHGGAVARLVLPLGIPWIGAHFALDALSAWFLLIAAIGGGTASVYALGYVGHLAEPRRSTAFLPVFLAAIDLVLVADDAFVFLLGWETMSVASWLLVLANHRDKGNAEAARLYLVMAMGGTAALLLAFGLLAGAQGGYRFDDMRSASPAPLAAAAIVALAMIGAGSKAGLFPLHAWLPLAHPAAPSHVSALMSGVMTKVAIYGLVRLLFDLAGPLDWGWGAALMAVGAVSAAMGILLALMERDLKTLLAYSTIENIGVIAVGLGLALVFRASAMPSLAALALAAALLHAFNHALMKSLMFLVAGAVQVATGTRDLEALGGLIRRLPVTAVLALVGAASLAALPPLAGFASEWLLFQAVLSAPSLAQWPLKFEVPVIGAMLALTAALAAACFVRAYGIAFLGRPRGEGARSAVEVEGPMRAAMAILAALCVAFGVLPGIALALLDGVLVQLAGTTLGGGAARLLWISPFGPERAAYGGALVLMLVALATWGALEALRRRPDARRRLAPAWDCGFPDPSPATQYTASSFAQPVRRIFGTMALHARERVDMPEPGETRAARFEQQLRDPAWAALYGPVLHGLGWLADRFSPLQYLTIRRYLTLVFMALIVLLVAVVLTT
jgi:hydrogenase-4 component B